MKKAWMICVVFLFAINGIAQDQMVVDPNARIRAVPGSFNAIKISGDIDLYLSQSATEAIAISASEEKYADEIKTEVENNVLRIYIDRDKKWGLKNRHIKAYVSFKTLQMLEASGASDIVVAGMITVSQLTIKISGASNFKGAVAVNSLTIKLSGASDLKISGTAARVSIESSGASDVHGFDLETDICVAHASGASDINLKVNKELTAHASGASTISYKGSAVLKEVRESGASSVGKKG